MARNDDPTVFSTDRSHERACPACGRQPCICPPAAEVVPGATRLRLRLERKGRGGKVVTVVDDLPAGAPDFFGPLLKQLKAHCGTGGALKAGRMEIQGDQRDRVQAFLERAGFTVRRAGG